MRARIWLGVAALLVLPSAAVADSGSITNVHAVAGGQIEATYTATSTYCTSYGYCGFFSYATQAGVTEPCDAASKRLIYVGSLQTTAGTQTGTGAFHPETTGPLKLCLHVRQADQEITVAEYVYTPPVATAPVPTTASSKVAPLTISDARANLTSVLRRAYGGRFAAHRNFKRDCYRLLVATVRCRVRWDHSPWRYSGAVDMKNDSVNADSLFYGLTIHRNRLATTSSSPSSPSPTSQPKPKAPASRCNPNYGGGVCLPLTGDVDCPDISATDFPVIGSDPFRLDGDNDGIACES